MKTTSIKKTYQDSTILNHITLDLEKGKAHGLLGVNGAGKSTLIKILMGLVFSSEGEVFKPDLVSFLPENPYLPNNLTAFQIITHACRMQKKAISEVSLILEEVSLSSKAWHKPIYSYSKGMKQRTAIAYALAAKPEWLILDEPMSGLDALGRKEMLELFSKRNQEGISILMCSHAVTDLVRLCDYVHVMHAGEICESITIDAHSMEKVEYLESRLFKWSVDSDLG